mgnify:CR=1 FL=1
MSYNVLSIQPFDKQLKRLSKKYPSLKEDFTSLVKSLKKEPKQGDLIGHNCYKIRLAIKSKGKGKSGGARIIINVVISEENVYLLAIYDKSNNSNITDLELKTLLKQI